MAYVMAIDQGTTSSRAIVFDHAGSIVAVAQREFAQHFPQPGWVEHDPIEIWATQSGVVTEALAMAGLASRDLAAIGITNQRETTLLWDRASGKPIAPAIVWQDRRTAGLCDQLRAAGHAPLFAEKTGLVLDAYFSGTKLKWLLDEIPGARGRADKGELAFGTIDSWIIWNLTAGAMHITDASNASRTLLFDIHRGDWDDALLRILDVPRSVLPTVVPSSGVCAHARIDGVEVPIAGIAGDQQAALFGQACLTPGLAKNTYGTGCFLLMNTGSEAVASRHRLVSTIAWERGTPASAGNLGASSAPSSDGLADRVAAAAPARRSPAPLRDDTQAPSSARFTYALEGSVFVGGAVVQWLRDGLGIIRSAPEVEALAASVPDNGGVYLVPAFAGLGAPHWDAYARGSLFGLTRGSSAAHIARAALESIAYQSAELLHAMQADAGLVLAELRVDGGATANNLLMQFQADVLGVPVVRPRVLETTALGAAYLAGLAVAYWRDESELASNWQVDRRFEPAMSRDRAEALMEGWKKAVSRAKSWA